MALLERVATLLRANVNDAVQKAEDPEKLLRQLLLDMENQLLQVKTQVAIAIADGHLLERKRAEHADAAEHWRSRAALALKRDDEALAREALARSLAESRMAHGFAEQMEDQAAESAMLRATYGKLEAKLAETRQQTELLLSERRRTRALSRAHAAVAGQQKTAKGQSRLRAQVEAEKTSMQVQRILAGGAEPASLPQDSLEDRFALLERDSQIEAMLQELKAAS